MGDLEAKMRRESEDLTTLGEQFRAFGLCLPVLHPLRRRLEFLLLSSCQELAQGL